MINTLRELYRCDKHIRYVIEYASMTLRILLPYSVNVEYLINIMRPLSFLFFTKCSCFSLGDLYGKIENKVPVSKMGVPLVETGVTRYLGS